MAQGTRRGSSSRSSTDAGTGGRRLCLGRVGRPHGRDGSVTVVGPTNRLELLDAGRSIRIGARDLKIVARSGGPRRPVVKLGGVEDRSAAAALTGETITVPAHELGPLDQDEYLIADLVGLEVVDGNRGVGIVRSVRTLPSVDVLEVERPAADLLLVPLVRDAVRSIDVPAGLVDVDLSFIEPGKETESDGD